MEEDLTLSILQKKRRKNSLKMSYIQLKANSAHDAYSSIQ